MSWEAYAWMAVLTLAQIIQILVKRKNGKDKSLSLGLTDNPHPCQSHGERIAKVEEAVCELKEDMKYIRDKLNGMAK
jgi:hypothetical protein